MTTQTKAEAVVNKNWAHVNVFEATLPECEVVNLHAKNPAVRATYSCALAKYCNLPECELKNNLQV